MSSSALVFAVFFILVDLALEQQIALLSPLIDTSYCEMWAVEIEDLFVIFHNLGCEQSLANHLFLFPLGFAAYIFQSSTRAFWIVWPQKNREGIPFVVPAKARRKPFSRQASYST